MDLFINYSKFYKDYQKTYQKTMVILIDQLFHIKNYVKYQIINMFKITVYKEYLELLAFYI